MKFGTSRDIALLDDQGSTKSVERVWHDGETKKIITEYRVRVKVTNQTEELAEIVRFRKEHPETHGTSVEFEETHRSKSLGFYYVVKCWSEKK